MAASVPSSVIALDGVPGIKIICTLLVMIIILMNIFFLEFIEVIVARIDEAVKEYSRQFDTLMTMLKEQVL